MSIEIQQTYTKNMNNLGAKKEQLITVLFYKLGGQNPSRNATIIEFRMKEKATRTCRC